MSYLLIFLVLPLFLGLGWIVWRRRLHIAAARTHSEQFFEIANRIVDDPAAPDWVVDNIEFMANHLRDGRITRFLFSVFLHGTLNGYSDDHRAMIEESSERLETLGKRTAHSYSRAIAHFAMANTFNSLFLGWLLRRALHFGILRPHRRHYDSGSSGERMVVAMKSKWHADVAEHGMAA